MLVNSLCYTVESVLQGHPDKVCDQIADAILDAFLQLDDNAKVAVECLGCGHNLVLAGEVSAITKIDAQNIAQEVYHDIGYLEPLHIASYIQGQSTQLRRVVDSGAAGDQAIMYGFACKSDFNFLPYGVLVANTIAKSIDTLRHRTHLFLPDGKLQISVRDGMIETLVVSVQHLSGVNIESLRRTIMENAIKPIVSPESIKTVLFNHNSSFVAGGFANDTGLSGRKLAIDNYGGLVPHGGGSFSGKDPSKVDRSGAYMARLVAKSIVANGLADSCIVALAYVFGEAEPVMVQLRTNNPGHDEKLTLLVNEQFDFRPLAIAERLDLRHTRFLPTATYGHFTDATYPWERTVSL